MHTSKTDLRTSGADQRARGRAQAAPTINPMVAEALSPTTPPERVRALVTDLLGFVTIRFLTRQELRDLLDADDAAMQLIHLNELLQGDSDEDDDNGGGAPALIRQPRGIDR